jgi:hypothetical protein
VRLGEWDEVHQEKLEDLVEVRRGERAQSALYGHGHGHANEHSTHLLVSFV